VRRGCRFVFFFFFCREGGGGEANRQRQRADFFPRLPPPRRSAKADDITTATNATANPTSVPTHRRRRTVSLSPLVELAVGWLVGGNPTPPPRLPWRKNTTTPTPNENEKRKGKQVKLLDYNKFSLNCIKYLIDIDIYLFLN
jgi:hypothetical protein